MSERINPRLKDNRKRRLHIRTGAAGMALAVMGSAALVHEIEQSQSDRGRQTADTVVRSVEGKIRQELQNKGPINGAERLAQVRSRLEGQNMNKLIVASQADSEYTRERVVSPERPVNMLLGTLRYHGPMQVKALAAVGPDGEEFFKVVDKQDNRDVEFINPLFEINDDGSLSLFGGLGNHTYGQVREVRLAPTQVVDALIGDSHPGGRGHDVSALFINGEPLHIQGGGHTIDYGQVHLYDDDKVEEEGAARFASALVDRIVPVTGYVSHGNSNGLTASIITASYLILGEIDGRSVITNMTPQVGFSRTA